MLVPGQSWPMLRGGGRGRWAGSVARRVGVGRRGSSPRDGCSMRVVVAGAAGRGRQSRDLPGQPRPQLAATEVGFGFNAIMVAQGGLRKPAVGAGRSVGGGGVGSVFERQAFCAGEPVD